MTLLLIAALPFVGAILAAASFRFGRNASAAAAAVTTAFALGLLITLVPQVISGQRVTAGVEWVPQLGLNLHFMLDGLGLLFAGLILGMGLLIILYARFYLSATDPMGQFFVSLLAFQGAMLGIVLSDNILLLLVFWELTSLSSFLLIGYWKHKPAARIGARMALTVTGAGGLALMAGMLILGNIAGSYDLSVILTKGAEIRTSEWYLVALVLILIGAFTKSAQFPFHFWLPYAMAAPTPVSAYLHSATMVKAGLFLLARLWPVLSGTEPWFYAVATTGLVTMLLGAKVALFRDDLKGLLAYSTISHLGLITFLLGLGTKTAAAAAVFHILCHASFKAALFMLVGIIEHATKTRSINALGGLRGKMPLTFGLTLVAALSMAGLPPLNGFLSKELMLNEAAQVVWAGSDLLVPVLTTLAAMFSVAYSLRLISRTFLGPTRTDYPKMPQDPPIGLWAAPAILVGLVVTIGIWPMGLTAWIVLAAGQAVVGQAVVVDITLWHGLGAASLWMSVAALGGGIALGGSFNVANKALTHLWTRVPRPDAKAIFDITLGGVIAGCRGVMVRLDDGAITRFIAIAITAIVGTSLYAFATGSHLPGTRIPMPMGFVPIVCWLVLGVALGAAVIKHRDRLFALLMVGVIGLILSLGFAYLSAPDLALTQITVEVVTVILMLLALQFLPKTSSDKTPALRRMRDAVIACVAGLALGALAYSLMMRDAAFSMISRFHLDNSKSGAGGNNAVNTIIVDFRGFDTYGEIIVLGIAALVIFALVDALLRAGPAKAPRNARNLAPQSGERHPVMLGVATRFLLPVMLLVGAHLFLRGHNLPGGGFVAGLVFAIAIVLQYVGSGYAWTEQRHRINEHTLIAAGVMIATATGVGSWLVDRPFLTSHFTYIQLPALAPFEVATATLFDLGVFLCVLGAVLLTLSSMARLGLPRTDPTQTKSGDR